MKGVLITNNSPPMHDRFARIMAGDKVRYTGKGTQYAFPDDDNTPPIGTVATVCLVSITLFQGVHIIRCYIETDKQHYVVYADNLEVIPT